MTPIRFTAAAFAFVAATAAQAADPAACTHPAMARAAACAAPAGIDANTFIVQPPVAVNWTVQEPERMLAATPGAVAR